MGDLQVIECVVCLFVGRVILPGLVLVGLGLGLAQWQRNRQSKHNF